ncbi:MAG: aminotransferase, partial [Acidobacteriota bacterium]
MDCQRPLFRLDPDVHYLNCAYMAPMLQTVEDAGCEGVRRRRTPSGIGADDFFREGEELRALFARLLSSEP